MLQVPRASLLSDVSELKHGFTRNTYNKNNRANKHSGRSSTFAKEQQMGLNGKQKRKARKKEAQLGHSLRPDILAKLSDDCRIERVSLRSDHCRL